MRVTALRVDANSRIAAFVHRSGARIGLLADAAGNIPVICAKLQRRYGFGQRRFASNTGGTAVFEKSSL